MPFHNDQIIYVNKDRPSGWTKKDWEIYAGFPVTVVSSVERANGRYEYLVIFREGPLKGESRWFKESELHSEDQTQEEMSEQEFRDIIRSASKI